MTWFGPNFQAHCSLPSGSVQGVWMYQRQGQDVVGYFSGNLRGNVLQFRWQEPGEPNHPLTGEGFLVFDTQGRQYSGRWWSDHRDRVGDWNGWRARLAGAEFWGTWPRPGRGAVAGIGPAAAGATGAVAGVAADVQLSPRRAAPCRMRSRRKTCEAGQA